jgi:hypothetical protein
MNRSEQMQYANKAIRIVSFNVIDKPGMVCIEVLKDRHSGKTGIQIIPRTDLLNLTIFA